MTTKIVLDNIASGYNLEVINANFQAVATELNEKVLYRDNPVGQVNTLQTDVDVNSKRLYNLPDPVGATEPATRGWINTNFSTEGLLAATASATASAAAALISQNVAAISETNANFDAGSAAYSRGLATEWAENPEDDPITGTVSNYSAKHWAAKALGYVTSLLASAIPVTPVGGISSTNVQAALAELDSEKLAITDLPSTGNRRNLLTNGAFTINQRNISSQSINSNLLWTLDRWRWIRGFSSPIVTQTVSNTVSVGGSPRNTVSFTVTLADPTVDAADVVYFGNAIENTRLLSTRGKQVTISFWVKSNIIGKYYIHVGNSSAQSIYSSYTINVADTWEFKTITLPTAPLDIGSYTSGASSFLNFVLVAGTAYSSTSPNTWGTALPYVAGTDQTNLMATLNNNIHFSEVQLEVGSAYTSFDYRGRDEEVSECERYLQVIRSPQNGLLHGIASGYNVSTTVGKFVIPLRREFHAKSPAVMSIVASSDFSIQHQAVSTVAVGVSLITLSKQSAVVDVTVASGLTAGNGSMLSLVDDATKYLSFSCE